MKKETNKNTIKGASVLLITALVILSTVAVTANTLNTKEIIEDDSGKEPLAADANGPYAGFVDQPIQFTGSATGGLPPYKVYEWDFGDGDVGKGQTISHTYIKTGTYEVVLTVLDSGGNDATDATDAVVTEKDNTPPKTVCGLEGEMQGDVYVSDVTVTLTANDDISGVDFTMVKVDEGSYQTYENPFVVTENGEHTVYYYSADNAGNIEDEQSTTFTIQKGESGDVQIDVVGFIGVTAFLYNNGTQNITGLEWSITLKGGLILYGESASGVEDIPADDEVIISTGIVLGLGPAKITVTVGSVEVTAEAFVLGPFVLIQD